ncbi:phytanoyl-CoA dioxygenase family protein [Kineococcus sp. SYSU DK004]|uniref:phytanoyl-CoA dioxygenase family protein n=1 Tax=Kineococcus sp. SYSU DK004 TaxID=3383125 RepID=UPI003D7D4A34
MTATTTRRPSSWLTREDCDLQEFRRLVEVGTDPADVPSADRVERGVPVYGERLRAHLAAGGDRAQVQDEIAHVLADGAGIAVFAGAFEADVVDRASAVYQEMIDEQRAAGVAGGDHFAKPGANDRVWGALEKLALRDPQVFFDYFATDVVDLVSVAWLGPQYQVISDLNVVNPGGTAQIPHRDYHLGFMPLETAVRFPAHVHRLSPVMTLQGAVAHVDMPVESGPTMYLPHSQKYGPGYLAVGLPEFRAYFDEHHVQLPLRKGDAVFFNPALFHCAGSNVSADVRRMANLLQVSSAFGRSLEAVDRLAVSEALYPVLRERRAAGASAQQLGNVVAASAEGYPFPTDLDLDQPIGRINPESQAELVLRCLDGDVDADGARAQLRAQAARRREVRA